MMSSERRTVAPSSEFIVICRRERFSKGGESPRSPILGGKERRPPTTVWWQKTRRIALSCGIKNIAYNALRKAKSLLEFLLVIGVERIISW